MKTFATIALSALFAASLHAQTALSLLSGNSLQLWNQQGQWSASGGTLSTNGSGERHVLTAVPFGDLKLTFEYNQTAPIGAKLRVWADKNNNGGLIIDLDRSGAQAGVGGIEALGKSSMGSVSEGWHKVEVSANDGQVRVSVDGQQVARGNGLGSRAGFVGFEATGAGGLQVRTLMLTPLGLNKLFNGTDLSGWKSVARGPDAKGGMGHTLVKTLSFGAAGGSTKAHDAKWNVQGGAIKGESGPGALENSTLADDAIVQVSAAVKGDVKADNFASVTLRGAQGQLGSGYSIGIGPYSGSINPVARRGFSKDSGSVEETIVIAGRTIAVWVGSSLAQVHTDTRAENANPAQGAKTSAGTVSLVLPNGGEQIDVKRVAMVALPKSYGLAAKAPAPPPPPVATTTTTTTAAAGPSAAETALLQQQQAEAKKTQEDQQNKQRSAALMTQALSTTDPQQQMQAYGQVVQIDPSNAAAVQGFKEAQAKLQASQAAEQQAESKQQQQQMDAQTREQQTNQALVQAQSNFLAGKLAAASTSLGVAERLAPDNPLVRDLRQRISSAQSLRGRLYFLGGGAGLLGSVALIGLWWRRRRQQRYLVLEVTRGLNAGKTFPLDKDLVRIGAVAQDGGQKNDFVVQDVEHEISRFHCEVARKNGQVYVTDLRSSNGTRLNGELLKPGAPALLRKGNRITLARSVDLTLNYQRRDREKKDA